MTGCTYFCSPIVELMRMADSDVPSTGKIYEACQSLHETVRTFPGLSAARRSVVKDFVRARWDMLTSDMHCAGYVLDPEFVKDSVTTNKVSSSIRHSSFAPQYSSVIHAAAL